MRSARPVSASLHVVILTGPVLFAMPPATVRSRAKATGTVAPNSGAGGQDLEFIIQVPFKIQP